MGLGWVPGESPGQEVGFGLPQGHYAVDQVTFAPAQCDYPVNLNHVPFVSAQAHYQVEQVYLDLPQEYHPGEPVRFVWQHRRLDWPHPQEPVRFVQHQGC